MSFLSKREEAYEVACLLKDYMVPRRNDEAESGSEWSIVSDVNLNDTYDLSDSDAEKIFNECCARRHEWAIGKSAMFLKNCLVPQMISHSLENFINFVNVRNTNWLTKGDILILRTLQYKKEEFSAMYESLIDLVPSKTEYDWTMVDTADTEDEERNDFEALDVTETVFFPVGEESFTTDPVMPENFLARSSPARNRESTPIVKNSPDHFSPISSYTFSSLKKHRMSEGDVVDIGSVYDIDEFSCTSEIRNISDIKKYDEMNDCYEKYSNDVMGYDEIDEASQNTTTDHELVRPRRSFRKKQPARAAPYEPPRARSAPRSTPPRKNRRDSRVTNSKSQDSFTALQNVINEREVVSSPRVQKLSDLLLQAQIEKEMAMASYYKVLTQKETLEYNKMTK